MHAAGMGLFEEIDELREQLKAAQCHTAEMQRALEKAREWAERSHPRCAKLGASNPAKCPLCTLLDKVLVPVACSRCGGRGSIADMQTASIRTDTLPPMVPCPECVETTA